MTEADYWDDYEEFTKLYNENCITVEDIREKLDLSRSKYRTYRKRGVEEGCLNVELRGQNTKKNEYKRPFAMLIHKQNKIYEYIESHYEIQDKQEVKKIIARELLENQKMDFKRLCIHCEKKCECVLL